MSLVVLTYVLLAGAAMTAIGVARLRLAAHRPVAVLLTTVLAANLVRTAIAPYIVTAPGSPSLLGAARVLFHVEEAGYLIEPIGIAAASVAVFLGRKPWPLLLVWALLVAG